MGDKVSSFLLCKKPLILLIIAALVIIAVSLVAFWPDPAESRNLVEWKRICEEVNSGNYEYTEITYYYNQVCDRPIELDNCLSESDYSYTFAKDHGFVSPYHIINIYFIDGTEVRLENWDTSQFCLYYKDRSYIIENEELFARISVAAGSDIKTPFFPPSALA